MIRLLALLALTPSLAVAQSNCAKRAHVTKRLSEVYGERVVLGGLQKGGQSVMEVWASDQTGSYTVLITRSDGISCVIFVGTDYFAVPVQQVTEGDPL